MHELAITRHLLKLTLAHAEENEATHIHQINIVIGQLSSFVDESLQFYWDILSAETLAEGARVKFSYQPMELSCGECEHCFSPPELIARCPQCQSPKIKVTGGDQCFLESIDIESTKEKEMELA